MCTVTWALGPDRVEVFQNRDERHSRLAAAGPQVHVRGERRILAPTDADAGGTWLGVNDRGLVVGLLNGGVLTPPPPGVEYRSRGLLVMELLTLPTLAAALDRLASERRVIYRGFQVFLVQPGSAPDVRAWDGSTLSGGRATSSSLPLVSSSLDPDHARRERQAAWRRIRATPGLLTTADLEAYHRSHEPAPGPWSVCMHREDARTVSASHVVVAGGRATFRYAPGPPCRTPFGAPVELDLVPEPPCVASPPPSSSA